MVKKIKDILSSLLSILPDKIKNANLKIYYGALLGVFILFIMFVVGWCYNLKTTGKADLTVIVQFFGVFTTATVFYTMLGKKVVDKDKDGYSDDDENIITSQVNSGKQISTQIINTRSGEPSKGV
jgi:hypothetical protein